MNNDLHQKYFQSGRNLLGREYPRNTGQGKPSYSLQKNKPESKLLDQVEILASNFDVNIEGNEEASSSWKQTSSPKKQLLFKDTQLHPNLLSAAQNLRYVATNQVQIETLSFFSESTWGNLKICAPRKCGKTTAILLCIFNELLNDVEKNNRQALILCPTLELAEMCYSCAQQLNKVCSFKLCLAVKGKSFNKSIKITENIIIATPDKASEIFISLDFKKIKYLFIDDANCLKNPKSQFKIFTQVCKKLRPRSRVIITTDSDSQVINEFLRENIELYTTINIENKPNYKNIKQVYVVYNSNDEKLNALDHFITVRPYSGQIVIFCETTNVVIQLEQFLQPKHIGVVKLFGGLSSTARSDILKQFGSNEIEVLITTQAFLHVIPSDQITQVINFEQLFEKDGLLVKEYDKRKFLLNEKSIGIFVSFVDERYKDFFFFKDESNNKNITFYNDEDIITVEEFKNLHRNV